MLGLSSPPLLDACLSGCPLPRPRLTKCTRAMNHFGKHMTLTSLESIATKSSLIECVVCKGGTHFRIWLVVAMHTHLSRRRTVIRGRVDDGCFCCRVKRRRDQCGTVSKTGSRDESNYEIHAHIATSLSIRCVCEFIQLALCGPV